MLGAFKSGDTVSKNPMRQTLVCCARAQGAREINAPPSKPMNSRRLIDRLVDGEELDKIPLIHAHRMQR
jgi:hypothetical protein